MRSSTPTKARAGAAPPASGRTTPGRRASPATRLGRTKASPAGKPPAPQAQAPQPVRAASPPPVPHDDDPASPVAADVPASRVTVAVRIKPTDGAKTLMRFGQRQENALRFTHIEGGRSEEPKAFAYDHLFDQADSQADVYRALGDKVLQLSLIHI